MLAQLENTKMVKFLPKGSLHFGGVGESIESFSVNENDVPSLPNLEDMH